jgi:hypothetical protein
VNATDAEARLPGILRRWPPQILLLVTFASFYFAIGPGNFFAVDEVMQEETAQALILRHSIDVPGMVDARFGRGGNWYTIKGPGLPMVSLPFVYLGIKLDDAAGSMNGGQLAGPPVGPPEQPLRWSGRLAISTSLAVNALAGGAIVAVLFMVGMRLLPNPRAALLMAISAGLATLVMSEATHFYQHELDALMVILAFWFFSVKGRAQLSSGAIFGGVSLGIAILARADAAAAAIVLWLYGAAIAWKLVRDLPDRWWRMMWQTILSAAGPILALAGYMYFNYLRFGSLLRSGYTSERERFVFDPAQIAKAVAGYLVSPGLSIFLFAPPLLLAIAGCRRAYRRWPLETITLVSAATIHLLIISSWKTWSGDLSYGPRYMVETIVLLMPLTLPAFEAAADRGSWRAVISVAATMLIGFMVQLVGVSVYVANIEGKRIAAGNVAHNAWVFDPGTSPIVSDLRDLVAHRNLSPWAIRALATPEFPLLLLIVLIAIVLVGGWRILNYFRAPESKPADLNSRTLPVGIVTAAVVPILIGFAMARPLEGPSVAHAIAVLNAGFAEHQAGHAITAEEDYALVLSVYPRSELARYNLGVLEQQAGRTGDAISLFQDVLREYPDFTPARRNLEYIIHTQFGFPPRQVP